MRLMFWLMVALIAVVLASFAVSNRETVTFALWPLSEAVELPLCLAVLAALLLGFLAGALFAWLAGGGGRREARRHRRRLAALERELAATQAQLPSLPAPGGSTAAHLPARG